MTSGTEDEQGHGNVHSIRKCRWSFLTRPQDDDGDYVAMGVTRLCALPLGNARGLGEHFHTLAGLPDVVVINTNAVFTCVFS